MRLAAQLFENAGWRTAALGGASLVGLLGGGSLYVRQRTLQQHPLQAAAAAQLRSSPEVQRLMESEAVSTDGFVGGYVDMIGGTAVLLLPLHTQAGAKGHARLEAEAQRAEEESPLGFALGADEYRWSLRHLEVTKVLPALAPTQVLFDAPAERELPAYAPAREPALPRSLLPREAQMLLPVDLTLMRWATIHLLTIGLVARWVSRHVARQRAATALEALIHVPADPSLLELRASALRVIAEETAPASGSILEAPAKIIVNTDDFYGGVLEGRELAAYNRVTSPTGTVDLFMHATRRSEKGGMTGWRLLSSSIVDTRETDEMLDAVDDADAARGAIRAVATRGSGHGEA